MSSTYLLRFDGASRGNPGPAASGFVIYLILPDKSKKILYKKGMFLGEATNNQAEYMAVFLGLKFMNEEKLNNIYIEGDSNLVIKQLNGEWQVKNPLLKEIFIEIKELMNKMNILSISHIYREYNTIADSICNSILDSR